MANMKRTVKAWAIVDASKKIEMADYFVEQDCCNYEETQALAVYKTQDEANTMNYSERHKIIPCTISFILPKKSP